MIIQNDLERVRLYTLILARKMRLADWDIRLDPRLSDDGNSASISCTDGRKVACLRLGRTFFDDSPVEQRHTIAHELTHIHLWGVMAASQTCKDAMGCAAFDVFWRNLIYQLELGVDGMADAIAPLLPTMAELEDEDADVLVHEGAIAA